MATPPRRAAPRLLVLVALLTPSWLRPAGGQIQLPLPTMPGVDQLLQMSSDESRLAGVADDAMRTASLSTGGGAEAGFGEELSSQVITNPSNLIFGLDGALYVASFTLDHLVRFELREPPPGAAAPLSASYSIFARELDGPSGLAVDHAGGGLFVASFGGDEVLRLSAGGKLSQRYGNEEEVDCPEGIAIAPDGLLYVSSWHRGWVVRYEVESGAFLGTFGPATGRPAFPEELAFSASGNLLVTHFYANVIERYDGESGQPLDPLQKGKLVRGPVGVTLGPDGCIYVASYKRNVVLKLDGETGEFLDVVAAAGELRGASAIAFRPTDGTLFVASYEDHRVVRFNHTGNVARTPWEAGRQRKGSTFVLPPPQAPPPGGGGDGAVAGVPGGGKRSSSWVTGPSTPAAAAVLRAADEAAARRAADEFKTP
jgi:sugar lactone lactonase YvrE